MAERAHPEDSGFKNKFFGLIKNKYRKKLFNRYDFCNAFIQNKIVIDIPCGVGWGTSRLKKAKKIIGIDISKEAIDYAKRHYRKTNVEFFEGSIDNLKFGNNSIDVIICLEGFEHIDKEIGLKFIDESKRILREKGMIILTCPVLNDDGKPTGNPYHLNEYPENELITLLNEHFRFIELKRIEGPDGPEIRFVGEKFSGYRGA